MVYCLNKNFGEASGNDHLQFICTVLYFNVCRNEEIWHPTTPTLWDEEGGILNITKNEADSGEEDDGLAVNQSNNDGMNMQEGANVGYELDDAEIPVEYKSSGVVQEGTNAGTEEVHQEENTEKDFQISVVKTSVSAHDGEDTKTEGTKEEEDSPINRIHSEILELTRKISLPEAGILNLIRATEEAENEAKRQQETAVAALSPSKESLLLWARAGHGSGDFSIQGAFSGLSPRDLKQTSTGPYVSKTPAAATRKATLPSDERGKVSVGDKKSLDTSPKKDRMITMSSEMDALGDVSVKPQTGEEVPHTAGKGTETRKSEMTDRDMLGLFKIINYQMSETTIRQTEKSFKAGFHQQQS